MNRRSLPVWSEHGVASIKAAQISLALRFNDSLHHGGTVSCRSGCHHCCYHPVHLSAVEGLLLYRRLVARGLWIPSIRERLKEHAKRTTDLTYEVWLLSLLPCPIFDEKTKKCRAYQDRPFQCRVTVSTGDRENCHPHRITNSAIVNKKDISREFYDEVAKVTRKHGIKLIVMPLSMALILGESIDKGEVTLEDSDIAVLKKFLEDTAP